MLRRQSLSKKSKGKTATETGADEVSKAQPRKQKRSSKPSAALQEIDSSDEEVPLSKSASPHVGSWRR
jgi:hypothetical protein